MAGLIGIIIPWLTGIVPVLTPLAAVGFCVIMAAGMFVHIIKREYKMLPMLIIVIILSVFVVYFRAATLAHQ